MRYCDGGHFFGVARDQAEKDTLAQGGEQILGGLHISGIRALEKASENRLKKRPGVSGSSLIGVKRRKVDRCA